MPPLELELLTVVKKHPFKEGSITQRRKLSSIGTSPRLVYYRNCMGDQLRGRYGSLEEVQQNFREATKICKREAKEKGKEYTEASFFSKIFHFDANIFEEGIIEDEYAELMQKLNELEEGCKKQGGKPVYSTSVRENYSTLIFICEKTPSFHISP